MMRVELREALERIEDNLAYLQKSPGILGKRVLSAVERGERAVRSVEEFLALAEGR